MITVRANNYSKEDYTQLLHIFRTGFETFIAQSGCGNEDNPCDNCPHKWCCDDVERVIEYLEREVKKNA